MPEFILTEEPRQLEKMFPAGERFALDPEIIARHRPDAHWSLLDDQGDIVGRCSLWWRDTPPYPGQRVGVIGHYAVSDAAAAGQVLQYACQELAAHACSFAVGPMDGSTWRSYRLVTEWGNEPAFFLEPNNPVDWPDHFLENGFKPFAEYFSAVEDRLDFDDPLRECNSNRMKSLQIRLRSLEPDQFEAELRRIYTVVRHSFAEHLLFKLIDEEEFLEIYHPFQHLVRHDCVLIAERDHEPIGFAFAIPDLLQANRGEMNDTLIIKALAVLPNRLYAGLGYLLLDQIRLVARQHGYTRLIHALMHDAGYMRRRISKIAKPIRRYALYSKELRS